MAVAKNFGERNSSARGFVTKPNPTFKNNFLPIPSLIPFQNQPVTKTKQTPYFPVQIKVLRFARLFVKCGGHLPDKIPGKTAHWKFESGGGFICSPEGGGSSRMSIMAWHIMRRLPKPVLCALAVFALVVIARA